jgi:hypothetical protein
LDAAMGLLIEGEDITFDGWSKSSGVAEAECHPFSGDGVDGAGGIADESDVAGSDAAQFATKGDGAAREATWLRRGEMTGEGGKVAERFLRTADFFVCGEGDTDFVGRDGSYVGLSEVAPVDFNEVCPGLDCIVLAEADAAGVDADFSEAGPCSDAGVVTVGSDQVASINGLAVGSNENASGGGFDVLDGVLPMKTHAKSEGAIEKKLVQDGAAESAAVSAEDSLGGCATTQEANAME